MRSTPGVSVGVVEEQLTVVAARPISARIVTILRLLVDFIASPFVPVAYSVANPMPKCDEIS
jgi:hypothetical protein